MITVPDIEFVYGGGAVERYHTMQIIVPNSVARHSFGVAWLCYILTEGAASTRLIMAALAHDLPEQITGDIPAPTKRAMRIYDSMKEYEESILTAQGVNFQLSVDERRVLKLADCLDGMMFCIQELRMGNKNARVVYGRYLSYIKEMNISLAEENVVRQVDKLYELELRK